MKEGSRARALHAMRYMTAEGPLRFGYGVLEESAEARMSRIATAPRRLPEQERGESLLPQPPRSRAWVAPLLDLRA